MNSIGFLPGADCDTPANGQVASVLSFGWWVGNDSSFTDFNQDPVSAYPPGFGTYEVSNDPGLFNGYFTFRLDPAVLSP